MKLSSLVGALAITTTAALGGCVAGDEVSETDTALIKGGQYPDLRTVVPLHLTWNKSNGREELRFSNGLANTGAGDFRLRPENVDGLTYAHQEILNSSGQIVDDEIVSTFFFHPNHNHWHIDKVAKFEIHQGTPTGPTFGNGVKTTFCMIDWYKLVGNANTKRRTYWDCATSYQGISAGWVDQYHQSTDGQALDMTGAAAGHYYVVSTVNWLCTFNETNCNNNTAWQGFDLIRSPNPDSSNIVVTDGDHNPCDNGLCGEGAPNR